MKTKTYHISNLGAFAGIVSADSNGYITYHDSPRYTGASDEQLEEWLDSRSLAVRNAALSEIAERKLREWRKAN